MTRRKSQKFRIVRKYAMPSPAQTKRMHNKLQAKRVELKQARVALKSAITSLENQGYRFYYEDSGWIHIDSIVNGLPIQLEHIKKFNEYQITIRRIKSEIRDLRDKINPKRVQYRELEEKNYQTYKLIRDNYDDDYMIPCTELNAIEHRQNDILRSIHGPRVPRDEEKKYIQSQIDEAQAKLAIALENVKKMESIYENIRSLKSIDYPYSFEAKLSPALSSEMSTMLQEARNAALAIEVQIDRLKDDLNPHLTLKNRLELYEEVKDQDLTLSEFFRLKQKRYRIRKMQIIRVCVDRYCYMTDFDLPVGLRCIHINSDDQVIPCDCVFNDYYSNDCVCDQRTACNCITGSRELTEKNRKLYNLGALEIEDSAYVQQYQLAKQGKFDNYEWIRDWSSTHRHRKRIASFVYNLALSRRL
jgi:hypothetical protein